MSRFTRNVALVLAFFLLLPAIALVAAPAPRPTIGTPSISPSSPGPNDQVTVTATVTPGNSGIQNVTLVYSTDNWKLSNITVVASYNSTSNIATAHIPAQYNGGHVEYYVVAFDNNNNKAVKDNNGNYYSYTVLAPTNTTTSTWIELAIVATVLGAGGMFAFYSLRPKSQTTSKRTTPD